MLPVVVDALGIILNATKESLKEMTFSKIEIKKLLRKLQNNSVRGLVKFCMVDMMYDTDLAEYYPADSFLLRSVK